MTRLHKRGSKHTCVWACDKGSSMGGCEISCLAQSHFFTHLSSVSQMSDPADDKYGLSESLCLTQPAEYYALRCIVPPYLLFNDTAIELMPPVPLCVCCAASLV